MTELCISGVFWLLRSTLELLNGNRFFYQFIHQEKVMICVSWTGLVLSLLLLQQFIIHLTASGVFLSVLLTKYSSAQMIRRSAHVFGFSWSDNNVSIKFSLKHKKMINTCLDRSLASQFVETMNPRIKMNNNSNVRHYIVLTSLKN